MDIVDDVHIMCMQWMGGSVHIMCMQWTVGRQGRLLQMSEEQRLDQSASL